MQGKLDKLAERYLTALKKFLTLGAGASLLPANGLGRQSVTLGLETLDVARMHEKALLTVVLPSFSNGNKDNLIKRAGKFFAEVITPIEETHLAALETKAQLQQLNQTLGQRTADLVVSNQHLKKGIVQRKAAEKALKKSGEHYTRLLEESGRLQKHLRLLTHGIISAQEDERKKISRELHNEVAQTLLGINVRLVTLKKEAAVNTKGLKKEIASTQRLVEASVQSINRFAHELDIHQPV